MRYHPGSQASTGRKNSVIDFWSQTVIKTPPAAFAEKKEHQVHRWLSENSGPRRPYWAMLAQQHYDLPVLPNQQQKDLFLGTFYFQQAETAKAKQDHKTALRYLTKAREHDNYRAHECYIEDAITDRRFTRALTHIKTLLKTYGCLAYLTLAEVYLKQAEARQGCPSIILSGLAAIRMAQCLGSLASTKTLSRQQLHHGQKARVPLQDQISELHNGFIALAQKHSKSIPSQGEVDMATNILIRAHNSSLRATIR